MHCLYSKVVSFRCSCHANVNHNRVTMENGAEKYLPSGLCDGLVEGKPSK